MTGTRIAASFGVLAVALAASALALWSRPSDGPIIGTLHLGAPISTLTLDRSAGLAFALSPSDGRVVVLDVRTAALGVGSRPSVMRTCSRRRWWMRGHTPASRQRR